MISKHLKSQAKSRLKTSAMQYTVDENGYLYAPSGRMLAALSNLGGDVSKVNKAANLILQSPSFPKIRQATESHLRALRYSSTDVEKQLAEMDEAPWRYLSVHSSVMNAKSMRAVTLQKLSSDIFRETGLPQKPLGKFRGENDVDFAKTKVAPEATEVRTVGMVSGKSK